MSSWIIYTDKRLYIQDQPAHRHGQDLVLSVDVENQPGIVECPRCRKRCNKKALLDREGHAKKESHGHQNHTG